jgi:hypothetical protein
MLRGGCDTAELNTVDQFFLPDSHQIHRHLAGHDVRAPLIAAFISSSAGTFLFFMIPRIIIPQVLPCSSLIGKLSAARGIIQPKAASIMFLPSRSFPVYAGYSVPRR